MLYDWTGKEIDPATTKPDPETIGRRLVTWEPQDRTLGGEKFDLGHPPTVVGPCLPPQKPKPSPARAAGTPLRKTVPLSKMPAAMRALGWWARRQASTLQNRVYVLLRRADSLS